MGLYDFVYFEMQKNLDEILRIDSLKQQNKLKHAVIETPDSETVISKESIRRRAENGAVERKYFLTGELNRLKFARNPK